MICSVALFSIEDVSPLVFPAGSPVVISLTQLLFLWIYLLSLAGPLAISEKGGTSYSLYPNIPIYHLLHPESSRDHAMSSSTQTVPIHLGRWATVQSTAFGAWGTAGGWQSDCAMLCSIFPTLKIAARREAAHWRIWRRISKTLRQLHRLFTGRTSEEPTRNMSFCSPTA